MIRTIYDSKKPQHISEFYYPTKVVMPDDGIKTINNIREINILENIIIEGTVGHGKSMLMRHLTLNEIITKQSLPIFIELRTLQKTESLTDTICSYLSDILEITISKANFEDLARSGKITLFLDGFDELNKDIVPNIVNLLEKWSISFPTMKIICSSRPYNSLQNSPHFLSLTLSPYDEQDQAGFIQKLTNDLEISKQLVQKIGESAIGLREVLKTPLMLTLFVMTYQTKLQIALSISDFYRDIFDVLMNRHDYLKSPFERVRYVNATQAELEDIFQEFCFYTKNNGNKTSFDKKYFSEGLQEACNILGLKFDYNEIISELTKNICLILKDGNEYSFIHKSIQEFFVANLLRSFDTSVLQKFYTDMYDVELYHRYEVELKFLSEIDKLNYYKFLVIPSIENFFADTEYLTKGIQPLLHSIYIVKNDPKISNFDKKILLFFNFEYEKKYGFINKYILINVLFYIIHKTEFIHLLEISSIYEKNINELEIDEAETIKIKQLLLTDRVLESAFQKLDTALKEAKEYVRSKTERNYKIIR